MDHEEPSADTSCASKSPLLSCEKGHLHLAVLGPTIDKAHCSPHVHMALGGRQVRHIFRARGETPLCPEPRVCMHQPTGSWPDCRRTDFA